MTAFDPALVAALHPEAVRREGLGTGAAHLAVQTSTFAALLDGTYDGEVTIGELLADGDLGLGTLDRLDGELTIVDGAAWQARTDGTVTRVDGSARTPFAVVVPFTPDVTAELDEPVDDAALHALIARLAPPGAGAAAIRLDGVFDRIHARTVPRQSPPYPSLAEVAAIQTESTFTDLEATVVGFRFPAAADGIEVTGTHLHFVSADRRRAGHVLSCDVRSGRLALAAVTSLRIELPAGVELPAPGAPSRADEVRRIESD